MRVFSHRGNRPNIGIVTILMIRNEMRQVSARVVQTLKHVHIRKVKRMCVRLL